MYKKIAAIALCSLVLTGTVAFADYKEEYPWAVEAVEYCMENNILRGDENGDLMLGEYLTQAQSAALINRTFDITAKKGSVQVSSKHWAKADIDALSGYFLRPNDFSADAGATREMYISTLMNAIGIEGEPKVSILKDKYSDYSASYPEYLAHLAAATALGFVEGSEGKLFPKDFLTRAEAITLIYRVNNSEKTPQEPTVETPAPVTMSLMGSPEIDVESAKAWAKTKGAHQRYIDVAQYYWKYGELTGIRPEVLYAQAGKETGYGNYGGRVLPEMNNWAGIKKYGAVGDETEDHETFATPEDGVRGHFNHISAYVGVDPVGETHGRYSSVKSLAWAGTITDVTQLGGTWCPDPEYGHQVINLVNEMINK